jgi:hypothetical protein
VKIDQILQKNRVEEIGECEEKKAEKFSEIQLDYLSTF